MAYRLSALAAEDVLSIYSYGVERFGVRQAEVYYAGLTDTLEFLAANPRGARERPEFRPPVRIHAYEAHVVIYVIDEPDIFVVRILYGRQDWARHL